MINFLQFRKNLCHNGTKTMHHTVCMCVLEKNRKRFFWEKSEKGQEANESAILENQNILPFAWFHQRVISEIVFNTSSDRLSGEFSRSVLCGTGSCDDLSADWKLRNHAGYGVGTASSPDGYIVRNCPECHEQFQCEGRSRFSRKIRYSQKIAN